MAHMFNLPSDLQITCVNLSGLPIFFSNSVLFLRKDILEISLKY
jgi:hypothetical protein